MEMHKCVGSGFDYSAKGFDCFGDDLGHLYFEFSTWDTDCDGCVDRVDHAIPINFCPYCGFTYQKKNRQKKKAGEGEEIV